MSRLREKCSRRIRDRAPLTAKSVKGRLIMVEAGDFARLKHGIRKHFADRDAITEAGGDTSIPSTPTSRGHECRSHHLAGIHGLHTRPYESAIKL